MEEYMLPCYAKEFLGFDCMGCGIQRSASYLIQGEFSAAFQLYPAIYPVFVLFGFILLNLFMKIKYAGIITPILGIVTALTIIVAYIIKLTNIF